jgi:hypothetical protein
LTDDLEEAGPGRPARALLLAVVLLPIVLAVVRAMRADWFPIGDSALLYVRARDVLTVHHPFLGSWTSASLSVGENMNNPGPLYDDLLAPVARTLPFASAAALGVGIVNSAAILGISATARHIGGWRMQRWMLLAAALLVWVMGSELVIDIWQAHALLLPFLLMVLLAAGLALGRWSLLPAAAAVATLLVQTHISYVYVLAVLGLATAVLLVATTGRPRRIPWRSLPTSRPVVLTLAVLAVLWAQPLWEQLFGPGKGNLARLATNASGGDARLGVGNGVRFAGRILVQPPWTLRHGFATLIPPTGLSKTSAEPIVEVRGILGVGPALLLLVALLVVLVLLAWTGRRTNRPRASVTRVTAAVVAATPLCLGLVTVSRLGLSQHHVRWLWPVGALVAAVVAWGAVDLAESRLPSPARRFAGLLPVVLTVVVAAGAVPYLAQPQGPVADYAAMPVLRRIFPQLPKVEPLAPVVYDTTHVRIYEAFSSAMLLHLQQLGIDFRVDNEPMVRQLGERRRATGDEPTRLFQLERIDVFLHDDAADCLIARASALDPAAERRAAVTADELTGEITSGRIVVDPAAWPAPLRDRVAAAAGDAREAHNLVLDGSLLQGRRGSLDDGVRSRLQLVDRWVSTTYALYATTDRPCPT